MKPTSSKRRCPPAQDARPFKQIKLSAFFRPAAAPADCFSTDESVGEEAEAKPAPEARVMEIEETDEVEGVEDLEEKEVDLDEEEGSTDSGGDEEEDEDEEQDGGKGDGP